MYECTPDEEDEITQVFALIDHERQGSITQAALAQALFGSALYDQQGARSAASKAAADEEQLGVGAFRACLVEAVTAAADNDSTAAGKPGPSIGTGLLGILEDLRKFYANERCDFRLANAAKAMYESLQVREEGRRLRQISLRQETEQQGVQEAQMMQAMEFNSAWSQNMTEFERQAQELEEQHIRKQQEEFAAFQEKLHTTPAKSYKFSRDLLLMKASVDSLAKQGRYDEAHKLKRKAAQLEKFEQMQLDNEHKMSIATKELQMRQQHQVQLDALRRRIQRGREEHKEHWLMGAQRLMQSHRNMVSDLKSKQAIETKRADVAVKLDLAASRSLLAKEKMKNHFADVGSRVDTGLKRSQSLSGSKNASRVG